MRCDKAIAMIESGRKTDEFNEHASSCTGCQSEQKLWDLLAEAKGIETGFEFTERVLERIRVEEGKPWRHSEQLQDERFTYSLDEFSDFPPESFGSLFLRGGLL
ncbi:MAG: hypothetical protein V1736_07590 [Pseudomonadota bacterium]